MSALLLMLVTFVGYIVMYRLYGRFLGKKIFELSTKAIVPAVEYEDGVDFVPTKKELIFGHHYTSIAGVGPIAGPAIGIIWGWLPAVLWIFLGSIFMGAVHDFGALVISLRNQGKSISDVASKYVNKRAQFAFFIIVFLDLLIIMAIFGLVIAVIFKMYPASVFPVWFEIPIAIMLGHLIYKLKKNHITLSIAALIMMYLTVIIGYYMKFQMPSVLGIPPTGVWTIILLVYAYIASVLPVTTLLQPRDFINSHQLLVAMVLLVGGVVGSALFTDMTLVAPAVQTQPSGAPPMFPFLFITIACGAISGLHCLVSSGTTSKQVRSESDSLFVGYGSMIMEGVLAILVVITVAAGIGMGYKGLTGIDAWNSHYASWGAAKGLTSKVEAFVVGSANMISTLGIPKFISLTIMGVFIASFASTSLDTATRIQRYVVTEVFSQFKVKWITNRYFVTALVVGAAAALAFATGADGKGALTLWPLFGSINQVLAAFALVVISFYLRTKGGFKWLFTGIPAAIMITITAHATVLNTQGFINSQKILLSVIGMIISVVILWVVVESIIQWKSKN